MSDKKNSGSDPGSAGVYQIRIAGHLGPQWAEWLEGMNLEQDADGCTLVTGPVADQAALHGLLRKVRDAGLPLISINRLESDT